MLNSVVKMAATRVQFLENEILLQVSCTVDFSLNIKETKFKKVIQVGKIYLQVAGSNVPRK